MKAEQAFIQGFVKRAAQEEIDEEKAVAMLLADLENQRASVPLNAMTLGGFAPYHKIRDLIAPRGTPSRLLNIAAPSTVLGGLGFAGGAFGLNNPVAAFAGLGLGGALGGGLGANRYNRELDAVIASIKAENNIEQ